MWWRTPVISAWEAENGNHCESNLRSETLQTLYYILKKKKKKGMCYILHQLHTRNASIRYSKHVQEDEI